MNKYLILLAILIGILIGNLIPVSWIMAGETDYLCFESCMENIGDPQVCIDLCSE